MNKLLFSYGVFVSNLADIGFENLDEDFLETKELTIEDVDNMDEDALVGLEKEYSIIFLLPRLKKQLEENRESLGIQDSMKEVWIDDDDLVGYIFQAEGSLPALDHIFTSISETTPNLRVYVYDFTSTLTQAYYEGDYDTGSLSHDPSEYIRSINKKLSKLADQGIVPDAINLDNVPIWRIFGECILRFKNDLLTVEGINVDFDGFSLDEYEDDDINTETYLISVCLGDEIRSPSFFGALIECQTQPTVEWDYLEEKYEDDLEDQLQYCETGLTADEFEEYVRKLFTRSLKAHLSD